VASTFTRLESSRFLPVGHIRSCIHKNVDATQTICNYRRIFERMWLLTMRRALRRALNLTEDVLSPYYKCTLSVVTQHAKADTFLCSQYLSRPLNYTLHRSHLMYHLFRLCASSINVHSSPYCKSLYGSS
jgi:hypothetical protein